MGRTLGDESTSAQQDDPVGWPSSPAWTLARVPDRDLDVRLLWRWLVEEAQELTSHLLSLAAGLKKSKFRPQGREGIFEKLQGFSQVLEEAVEIAEKDLERTRFSLNNS